MPLQYITSYQRGKQLLVHNGYSDRWLLNNYLLEMKKHKDAATRMLHEYFENRPKTKFTRYIPQYQFK